MLCRLYASLAEIEETKTTAFWSIVVGLLNILFPHSTANIYFYRIDVGYTLWLEKIKEAQNMRESERVRNKRMKKGNFFHCSTIDNFFGSILGLSSSIRRRIPIIKSLWQTILFPIVCVSTHLYWYVSITKEMDHGGKCYKNISTFDFDYFDWRKRNF